MSARIPDTMLLSDLLKPTGYNCPEELQGKTFEEATSGGGDAKISTNTEKTIDVSAYTEPVVVEPAEGYDATKKVTITLDNIPSPSSGATAYAWKHSGTTVQYFDFAVAPADLAGMSASKSLESGGGGVITVFPEEGEVDAYTRTSDTEFTVTFGSTELTFVRDSSKDFTLWG